MKLIRSHSHIQYFNTNCLENATNKTHVQPSALSKGQKLNIRLLSSNLSSLKPCLTVNLLQEKLTVKGDENGTEKCYERQK